LAKLIKTKSTQKNVKVKGFNQKPSKKVSIEKTQWHPAFFQAMQIELEKYKNHLTYENEHHLTTEPLRLDILIIKKNPEIQIEKNIGRIFRGHNIVEFKSPADSLSINDYYKVIGYTYLYCSLEKIFPQDLTITLAFTVKPENLLEHLKTRPEITIEEKFDGIKYIIGEPIPIQLIENERLDPGENTWLRALSQETPAPIIKTIIQARNKTSVESGAFWYAVFRENFDAMKEVIAEMSNAAFEDFLDEIGFAEKAEIEKARQEAKQKEAEVKKARQEMKQKEAIIKQNEATIKQREDTIKQSEDTIKQNEVTMKQSEATIISLTDIIQKQEKEKSLLQKQAEEEKLLSIKEMLQDGASIELISKYFFISIDRVKEIKKELEREES
jgi:hypothetical protein